MITGAGMPVLPGIAMMTVHMMSTSIVIAVMNVMSLRASAGRLLRGVAADVGNAVKGKRHRGHQHHASGQAPDVVPRSSVQNSLRPRTYLSFGFRIVYFQA